MYNCVFGIKIRDCNGDESDSIKLLYKEEKYYRNGKLVENTNEFCIDDENCEIHLIPYDDYLIDGKKPEIKIIKNDEEYYLIQRDNRAYFGNISLCESTCSQVLGFKAGIDGISLKQMAELIDLRNKLFAQKRIKGNFYFGCDCCS
jgi:hypothetical protein